MATLCIGGVCVPYTAILPLLVIALKWVATKVASLGLLPKAIEQRLGIQAASCCEAAEIPEGKQSGASELSNSSASFPAKVTEIQTVDEWNGTLQDQRCVVAKFTATWCKPCKEIEPHFHKLASKYDAAFVKVDVDDLDEVAQECRVAMMPTFVVFRDKAQAGTCTGCNEDKLERLISELCSIRATRT